MRVIAKGPEPRSLTVHRQSPHCDYDNYQDKGALRQALAAEQRGLCCYCMGRIQPDANAMKIEHWQCQAGYLHEQLNYRNILGACLGGEGQPPRSQRCDTRKDDTDLLWNPADPKRDIVSWLSYGTDGAIVSGGFEFNRQLDEVLNLNLAILKNNRKPVLDVVLDWWRRHSPVPRHRIELEIDRHAPANGQFRPYSQIAVWLLQQKLGRTP